MEGVILEGNVQEYKTTLGPLTSMILQNEMK